MALKFRRGTTAQKSGSLAFGEPYVNTTLGTLQIGGASGDITLLINSASQGISGSSLDITGNAKIDGNLTLGGNITIGDNTSDTVTVTANLSSSLIPSVTNTFDLGSSTKIWRDLYLSTGSIKLVDGGGNIVNTITNANIVTTDTISSGSVNLTSSLPTGSVSGSSQINLKNTTGFTAYDTALATITGSLIASASADRISISNINTFSGSQLTQNSSLATITGSLILTASNNVQRLGAIESVSGSWITESETSSFARTNTTNTFTGTQTVTGDLNVSGIITANEFHTTFVTSSVMYNSGSNRFGDSADDLQQLIGIVEITGSIKGTQFNNLATITGSLITTASNHEQRIAANESISSSYARTNLSNTFSNNQIVSGNIELTGRLTAGLAVSASGLNINKADGNVQIELSNSTTGRGFHLISYNGDSFSIHNPQTGQSAFRIDSGSQYHSHFFGNIYVLSGSVVASNGITGSIAATNGVVSGSSQITLQSTTGFTSYDSALATITGSLISSASTDASKFTTLATTTGSLQTSVSNLNSFSSSTLTRLTTLEVETANLELTTASLNTSVSNLNSFSSSQLGKDSTLATYTGSVETRLTQIGVVSGSLITSASNAKTTNDAQDVSITNLNTFSGSQLTQNSSLATITGSLILTASANTTSITNLNSFSSSQLTQNSSLATITGSLITTASNLTQRIAANEAVSGTFARTNSSNVFNGTQTITGSLYISQDLVVAGSSSIQNISSSNLVIGTAYVTLNTNTPSSRFAGLQIIDSGSAGSSGSFLYDAVQDEFIFVHKGNGTNVTSSHFILGPETYDNLGSESYLTNNRLPKGSGKEHLNDSQISDDGTTVTIPGALTVTGNITGPIRATNGIFSGSSQIPNSSITNAQLANPNITIAGYATALGTALSAAAIGNAIGAFSGSSQVDLTATTNYASGILTRLNAVGVVSGSSQVIGILSSLNSYTASNDTTNTTQNSRLDQLSTASGSATTRLTALEVETSNLESFTSSINTTIKNKLDADGVISSSAQLTTTFDSRYLNTGGDSVVSGSSQIDATTTTNWSTGIKTQLNSNTVVSGSSQIVGSSITTNTVTIGSTSIALGGTATTIAGLSSVSSTGFTGALTGNASTATTLQNARLINGTSFDGSSNITIQNLVSGSSQITLSGVTGYSSVINQAVLTSSSPTFAGLTINGAITATGDITAYFTSDKRHKNNIQIIPNALEKVSKLNGVTWEWNDDVNEVTKSTPKTGLIAQEVQEVLPEVVKEREDGFLSLDYSKMMGLLVEAIKEQQTHIHNLTLQIEELKKQKGL